MRHICKFVFMILITGGTGLVGAHLLLKLAEEGQTLRAIYRNAAHIKKTKQVFSHNNKEALFTIIEWVVADITDVPSLEDAFIGITKVYHCAAYISFNPKDEDKLRKINIEGTANMVNLALANNVQKFCHVSSIGALGDVLNPGDTITEETEWNPEVRHNDYAISKYGAEMEVWRAWQEGLDVVIVNPGLIFGYGFWDHGTGKMFKQVQSGQYFYTLGKCGIVAVEDVVNIMMQLMQSDSNGERYTIVADNLTFKEMLDTVAAGMGKKGPSIYATKLITGIGWRLDWLLSKLFMKNRMLTRNMAQSSHGTEVYDAGKITARLNYKFISGKTCLKHLAEVYSQL